MSIYESHAPRAVPEELVQAALRASRAQGVPVAEVPVIAVAEEAGISRSTLMRRLGGSRRALDEAVREAGVDPGGQKPVRERAEEAAGLLIGRHGLAATTLERVAAAAECSVHSLYAVFGGRDELLFAAYERYGPILDVEAVLTVPRADLPDTVRAVYRALVDALGREPRVLPAMLAETLSRPDDLAVQAMAERLLSRLLDGVGRWLRQEMSEGRIRDLPLVPLLHQMVGPVVLHFLLRPVTEHLPEAELPAIEATIDLFTESFLHAVTRTPAS
ncbi:TetR family transcriptional regulator [Streptomyces sp. NPDC032940]|uniref:TetR family transcriptional regulator n=1 Tax=Streptomyces sp. NPDC032940 TaxID=3155366 RepID=UPI00340DE95F